jgi:hypothetical protein
MPLQDVIVEINLSSPAPKVGLGRPLILAQKTGASTYKEYKNDVELMMDGFMAGSAVHNKAQAIFEQPNRPDKVAVATYDTSISTALTDYYNYPWHFALVANDLQADQVAAATFMSAKDFKFLAVQALTSVARTALKSKHRVIVFDNPIATEHLDAAAVGNLASLPVGSITWKFKELKGITPRTLTDSEMSAIDTANAIAFVLKGGRGQLSEGIDSYNEYIDVLHGQDWVKVDMENEIQNVLVSSAKLPFDARGINAFEAAATTTLQRAYRNGIIAQDVNGLPDYKITTLSREEVDSQDRSDRIYSGLKFEFALAGAIHEGQVTGTILN